jgi:hypothetical protein
MANDETLPFDPIAAAGACVWRRGARKIHGMLERLCHSLPSKA